MPVSQSIPHVQLDSTQRRPALSLRRPTMSKNGHVSGVEAGASNHRRRHIVIGPRIMNRFLRLREWDACGPRVPHAKTRA